MNLSMNTQHEGPTMKALAPRTHAMNFSVMASIGPNRGGWIQWFRWILVASLASTWAAPGSAQPRPAPSQTFTEVVEVRVVNLEVVVTDRQGNRVTGLGLDDFELLIDGEPVSIDYFTEVRDGLVRGGGPSDQSEAAGIEAEDATEAARSGRRDVPGLASGEAVATHYLVFVDEYFSLRRDRDRVLDGLIDQLGTLGDRDRMAIVRYDGRDLEMLSTWSSDRAVLRDALGRAKGQKGGGLQRIVELEQRDFASRRGDLDLGGSSFGQLGVEERYYVQRITEQVDRVVTAAVSTLRGFAAPPGRKVMLMLIGGWPFDPSEYVVDQAGRAITETDIRRGYELLSPLTDTANLLGYTLYPIDVPGFQASAVDANASFDAASGALGSRSFLRETGLQQTLYHLAAETGGLPFINTARDQALSRVVEDTRTFYWLGYTPERSGDDQRHDVEIRVRGEGLRVRGREDYFDFSRQREVTLAVESALYFGTPASSQPLGVRLGRGARSGLRTMTVPVEVRIPADAITLLPGPGGFGAQLELRVAVLDDRGATADTPVVPLSFSLAERPPPGSVLRYDTEIKMRRKPHDLVIAVYDVATGTILSSSVEVVP